MNIKQFARSGGNATKKKYGTTHFAKLGKRGVDSLRKKVAPDYFKVQLPNFARMARIKKKLLKESKGANPPVENQAQEKADTTEQLAQL